MTEENKEVLLHFVTRISMYIHPVEASSAVNFIHGFEAGTGSKRDFTEPLHQLISEKYKVDGGCLGWPEQVRRLAEKRALPWITTFRRLVPEVIAYTQKNELTHPQQAILRKKTSSWLGRIEPAGAPWFNADWGKEWQSVCAVKSKWFRQLWTRQEWTVIRAIDRLVQDNGLFQDKNQRLPSPALLQAKEAYGKVTSKGEAAKKA